MKIKLVLVMLGASLSVFQNRSFTKQERYLLWKVRKLYHIRNSGLCYQAEPSSFFDRLLG